MKVRGIEERRVMGLGGGKPEGGTDEEEKKLKKERAEQNKK